ncbi:MAG: Zn2+/Cd2+-exporting ATPase, partial [Gammaproteobacteria bacterium]|nr:Zn2+/Cd2+-exporting ATPase [Gammaproteobacteria bacterium]
MDSAVASATSGPTPLRYRVDGMDCPSCASKIETALKRLGGGEGILVNYHSQTLALRLDEASTPRAAIENQIRSLGHDVSLLEAPSFSPISNPAAAQSASDAAAGVKPWWRTRKAVPLLAIGALLILGYLLGQVLPEVGGWPELPAALLGLWFAWGRAVALARAGSPFSIEMLMSIATV